MKRFSSAASILFLAAGLILVGDIPVQAASLRPISSNQARTLTFGERVAYQRAIEEVYWRHRIWPKENSRSKPSLDEVMPSAQIEQKVEDYLLDSQLLADQWQRPITCEQLQAEMDRMASHTKQPEVLRELFAALGNDPFVIAECLVRPILAEQLVAQINGTTSEPPRAQSSDPIELPLSGSTRFLDSARNASLYNSTYTLPEIFVPLDCPDGTWSPTSATNAPVGRNSQTAVWTGSEMIVWGGAQAAGVYFNTGGRYNPSTDSWTATHTTNAPAIRYQHTAVWTGSRMIVWGGHSGSSGVNTGGRYDPITNSWTATSTTGAPAARELHTAVWTGSQMIVWGGNSSDGLLNTGGRYDPATNSWTATSTTDAPAARLGHLAVWAGSEMIAWGGFAGGPGDSNTGGRYDPITNSWTSTSTTGAPTGRELDTAVWTGSEMIIWGGYNGSYFNTGGRYKPSTDSWTATSTTNAPEARFDHTAVWNGSEMIVWGGYQSPSYFNTGGRYNPNTDSWTATSTASASAARELHTAVWTGSQMIVWGGTGSDGPYFNTGGRYCAQPSTPIVQGTTSRKAHGSAGNFDVDLPLSGTPGIECRSGGPTNDYTIVISFLANVSVDGNPQAAVTSGVATVGSGGIANGGNVIISGNVVAIPLTNVANAQTISVKLGGINGSTDVIVPMSILVGDVGGNGIVNASDVSLTKSRIGQTIDANNFRSDVNASGSISASDVSLIKSKTGTALP